MPTQELKLVVQWKCSLGSTTEQQHGHRKLCISIPHLDIYVDIKVCFFSFVGDIFLKKKIYERYYIYWILGVKKLPKKKCVDSLACKTDTIHFHFSFCFSISCLAQSCLFELADAAGEKKS